MKGDFSRDTFDKTKRFSRVLMQQGRVQLDADSNEQASILLHYLRTLAADLIGPFAGPAGTEWGFEVKDPGAGIKDFMLGNGRYYVDGILCENDGANVSYKNQQDFPNPPPLELDTNSSYLVYLDVWERHITATEDDYIREKALGGPDTASRAKVVWQVKLWKMDTDGTPQLRETEDKVDQIRNGWKAWIHQESWQPPHLGCLKVRVKRPTDSNDPCFTAPDAKYRGMENRLYRVEIHSKGTAGEAGGATFKWSCDNGTIVTGSALSGAELTVHHPRGFAPNQWVELTNEGQELRGEPGTLVKLLKVESDVLTLASAPSPANAIQNGETWPTKVRRWDQNEKGTPNLVSGAMLVEEGSGEAHWIDLNEGIQIQFQPPAKGELNRYRTGDYWLIPARVATGDIEWPQDEDEQENATPAAEPPHGIRHHYAPLAILTWQQTEWKAGDCRCDFKVANGCNLPSYGEDGIGGAPVCKPSASRPGKSYSLRREPHLHKKPQPK